VAEREFPAGLDPARHRELRGRHALLVRRVVLTLLFAFVVAALLNVFGQHASNSSASSADADLHVRSPTRLRSGLIFQARFDVVAHRTLAQPKLVLDTGWIEGMTINTTEPSAMSEATRNGRAVFSFDTLDAGERLTFWIQAQVNPTTVGRRRWGVELDDRSVPLARVQRTAYVFP
jgi:hypothetical protein